MNLVRGPKGDPSRWGAKGGVIWWLDKEEIEHTGVTIRSSKGDVVWSVKLEENILKKLWEFVIKLVVITTNDPEGMGATI